MPKAPPFTAQNAAEMARRSAAVRAQNRQRELDAVAQAQNLTRSSYTEAGESPAVARTKLQLARIDEEIDRALEGRRFEQVAELSAIKAKLWPLAQPTAGTLKPSRQKQTQRGALNLGLLAADPATTPQQVVFQPENQEPKPAN